MVKRHSLLHKVFEINSLHNDNYHCFDIFDTYTETASLYFNVTSFLGVLNILDL